MDAPERQRRIFDAYLVDSYAESIKWQPCKLEEMGPYQQTYDVDFLAFQSIGAVLAASSNVSSLLSAGMAKVYGRCSLQRIRTNPPREAFVFMRIGDYQIGVTRMTTIHAPLPPTISMPDEEDHTAAVEKLDATDATDATDARLPSLHGAEHEYGADQHDSEATMAMEGPSPHLRAHINAKLAKHGRIAIGGVTTTTCRDGLDFIGECFGDADLVLFRYGQKQPLAEVSGLLANLMHQGVVDVAIGTELFVAGKFVTGRYHQGQGVFGNATTTPTTTTKSTKSCHYGHQCYSNFASKVSCNYVVSGCTSAGGMIRGSNRVVLYNTLQHAKKHLQLGLSLHGDDDKMTTVDAIGCGGGVGNIIRGVSDAVHGNMEKTISLLEHAVSNAKLRLETYLTLNIGDDIEKCKNLLNRCLETKFPYVWADMEEVKRKLILEAKLLQLVFTNFVWWDGFSGMYLLFKVYKNFTDGLFSRNVITEDFIQHSFGFSVDRKTFQHSEHVVSLHGKDVVSEWHSMIHAILYWFPKNRWPFVSLYCRMYLLHEFGNHLPELRVEWGPFLSSSKSLLAEVLLEKYATTATLTTHHHHRRGSCLPEAVSLMKFLDLASIHASSRYVALFLDAFTNVVKTNHQLANMLLGSIHQLTLHVTALKSYVYVKRSTFTTMSELCELVRETSFHDMKKACEEYINGVSNGNGWMEKIFVLKEEVIEREAFRLATERLGGQTPTMKKFRYPDLDSFLRFIYARAFKFNNSGNGNHHKNNNNNNIIITSEFFNPSMENISVLELFESPKDFFSFLILGLITCIFITNTDHSMRFIKIKEAFKHKIMHAPGAYHYHFSQLLYFTGIFMIDGRMPNYEVCCPVKCKITSMLPVHMRPPLIANVASPCFLSGSFDIPCGVSSKKLELYESLITTAMFSVKSIAANKCSMNVQYSPFKDRGRICDDNDAVGMHAADCIITSQSKSNNMAMDDQAQGRNQKMHHHHGSGERHHRNLPIRWHGCGMPP